MRLILTTLLLVVVNGLQAKSWTPSVQLEPGDRVGVLDSASGALIVYEVPSAGILQITDGNHPVTSKMHYVTEYEPGGSRRTYIFPGALGATIKPIFAQSSADHKVLGTGADGATLAGAATLTLSASGAGTSAIALAEVVTAIGTVTLEFIPVVAVATGITLTVYYVHKGVTDWLDDVQGFPNGVRLFAEYVAKEWMYARAAVVFTATAQLLMELEDIADEELVEVVDALWVSDDINKIRDFISDPDPEDNRAKIIKKIILGGITFVGIQTLTRLAEDYSDDLKKVIEEVKKRWEKNHRRVILICEDDPGEIPLFSFLIPENVRDAYDLEYVKTTEEAEVFITTRGDEIAAIILDGKMPPEMTGFATERLLPLIGEEIPIIGNSDSRETQSLMNETGRFFYICQEKTGDLPKVPWGQILPLLE